MDPSPLNVAGLSEHQTRGTKDKYNDPYWEESNYGDTNSCG